MDINSAFPSKYLRAADLSGRTIDTKIRGLVMEEVGSEQKPVLYFDDGKQGLIVNKTNSGVLAEAYGPETDGWTGQPVTLFTTRVQFQGRMVDAIRVRVPRSESV